MKLCIISKYPPIQGGISAKTYWMTRGFVERGIEIHVVTNANCVERDYFIDDSLPDVPSQLQVHFVTPQIPWHIPNSELYSARLLDKTLEVIEECRIDLIDTHFLIPYGIVGYLASKIKGIPYIIRHGGSDIVKFLRAGTFEYLLNKVVREASAIITDRKNKMLFNSMNSNVFELPRYIPDERYFNSHAILHKTPIFAYIGKINYYWKHKSLDKIVNIFSTFPENHKLLFVGQGRGREEFLRFTDNLNLINFELNKFIHPVNMPDLLSKIDFLLYFDQNNLIKDFSNIICEAIWSGIPIIKDKNVSLEKYFDYIEIKSNDQIITIEPEDIKASQKRISNIIGTSSHYNNKIRYDFERYINENLHIFNRI